MRVAIQLFKWHVRFQYVDRRLYSVMLTLDTPGNVDSHIRTRTRSIRDEQYRGREVHWRYVVLAIAPDE